MDKWRTGRRCVYKNNIYLLIFVTKYRRRVFNLEMLNRLKALFSSTCVQMDAELIEFGGKRDHVHILLNVPPKLAIAALVGRLKGTSSYF